MDLTASQAERLAPAMGDAPANAVDVRLRAARWRAEGRLPD
jgi:hypothetical protein